MAVKMLSETMNDDLFDESVGYDEEIGHHFAEGLTDDEKGLARLLYRQFKGLWGVCLVKGDPGAGKDLFGNWLAHRIKTFFPWKRILRDERPRKLFGKYAGLFNEQVLHDDLLTMRMIAKGFGVKERDNAMDEVADEWVKGSGEVLLKNSVLYLTEYYRYVYNREPHNPMNRTMGAIHKSKRHLDCLIIGTTQLLSDLDKKTSKPWVDWITTCTRSRLNTTGFTYFIQPVKYDMRRDTFEHRGTPGVIAFDAGKPRGDLGDGKIHIAKMNYKPETEEERVVFDVLKSGVDTYKELVDILETDGDMNEAETLITLKTLRFNTRKRAISYNCFFGLYNSKSAPQIRTKVRVED